MLGCVPRFISAVGFDEQADKVLDRMSQSQLPTDFVQRNQFSTGAVNVSFADGEPEYEIPLGQAFDHIEYDPATIESVTPSLLYHGSLIWRNPTSRESLTHLRSNIQAPIFVDLNLRLYSCRRLTKSLTTSRKPTASAPPRNNTEHKRAWHTCLPKPNRSPCLCGAKLGQITAWGVPSKG